jgi:pyruvate dehydrogenase E1 component alpha subunit
MDKYLNPDLNLSPVDLKNIDNDEILFHLKTMISIRAVEQRLAKEKEAGTIKGPVHLGVGQEAIASGIARSIIRGDFVYGAHRSHAHVLALGASIYKLFAEILAKDTGLSKGMGGSMHLYDIDNSFAGAVPIVAGTIPLAVGSALAQKLKKTGNIGVTFLGDGAVEEGVFHESLNLAAFMDLPVLFVIENNLMASHMHISQRQPLYYCSRFAKANMIPFEIVDGNDPFIVSKVASKAIDKMRAGFNSPFLIEAFTYRWFGHVDYREDIDVGVSRSSSELKKWKRRDPIQRTLDAIKLKDNAIDLQNDINLFHSDLQNIIDESWSRALLDPYPSNDSLLERVYE